MQKRPYDATNVKPTGGFEPVPTGTYLICVKNVTEKETKNGDPMYSVEFEIANKEYLGRKVWYNVTLLPSDDGTGQPAKGAGMAIHFLKCLGEPWEGKITVDPNKWFGKYLSAKIGIEKDYMGRDRNAIASISPCDDEEVPF